MREFVSEKVKNLKPSGIRKFFDLCQGSGDIVSLGVGEPDFITPWQISDAGIRSIKEGRTQYTSNKGLESLRQEISTYQKQRFSVNFDKEEIMITVGASEGIDLALRAIINPGDEVLIPDPSYVSYAPCVTLAGGVPVAIKCTADTGFKITRDNLKSVITPKTKALIFPYPNNPTGGIMERENIEKIIDIIVENDLLVISDEIYAELTYGEKHTSIASFKELEDRVILINGFSKAFAMTGWRIGYICAKGELFDAMLKIHQYTLICAPVFSQYAALDGLRNCMRNDFKIVQEMHAEYDRRRKFMFNSFNEMGLECFEPKGAFYIFPSIQSTGLDGQEFASKLIKEKKVAVVPGDAFGESGKYFIRCSYASSMKNLITAIDRIKELVDELTR